MPSSKRILLAGLFHETHTFVDDVTGLGQFQILRGPEMLTRKGDASPLGGVLETAERLGWEVIPTVDYRALPTGIVEDAVVETFWTDFLSKAEQPLREGLDAIYLVLHGAMASQSLPDVEGEVLERIRALPGAASLPIFGVFDLHAHYTARMAQHANCLVAFRENPHIDGRAMAVRAAELLEATLSSGQEARTFWRHSAVMWPPTGTGTANPPMLDLEKLARELESQHPEFLNVSVSAGFSFADTPDTGVSFAISTTGEESVAQAALQGLCETAWNLRQAGDAQDLPLHEVLDKCAQAALTSASGPLVVVEPSDNIGGGAPGDGTGLLRGLVSRGIDNAAICLNDPAAVAALQGVQPGQEITLSLGGKGSRLDEGPLDLAVTLVSRQSGHFQLEDKQSHLAAMSGDSFDMGPCAVVKHRGLTLLLTSVKTPPFDLGQWSSQGVEPRDLRVIGVKAAVAHRRAYDHIASQMIWVDTPGPCRGDLRKLPFHKVRRPVYPLDQA